jgi:hypothetical protein
MTNSKQQTAMQELIQRLKALHENHFGEVGLEISIEIASQLLEKEKDQMIEFILNNRNITSQVTYKDAEQYYKETYGNDKQ